MGRLVRVALTVGLAAFLLVLALRGTDWGAFSAAIRDLSARWLVLALVLQTGAMLLRGARWNVLLSAHKGSSFATAFLGEMFGYLGNNFLPARAGEAMRAFVVGRRVRGGISFVLGTITMERISDAVFMSLTAFVVVLVLPNAPPWLLGAAAGLFAAGVAVILAILFTARVRKLVLRPLKRIPRLSPLVTKAEVLLGRFTQGAHALYQPQRLSGFLGLTLMVWTLDVSALVSIAMAMGLPLTPPQALLFQSAMALSKAVPSTPGYVGVYQFVAVAVLPGFGFTHTQALAYVLVYQGALILQSLVWGLPGWLVLGTNRSGYQARTHRTRKARRLRQRTELDPETIAPGGST